ncbi:MAG: hypothetical protein WBQ69_05195 [Gallionella sp.]
MIAFYTEREVIDLLEIKNISEAIAAGELPKNAAQTIHGGRLWEYKTITALQGERKCES